MISVFKNNFNRLMSKKSVLIMMIILTLCAILAALFFSSRPATIANVAFVSSSEEKMDFKYLNITMLDKEPPTSSMVSGTYDAIVTVREDGNYQIQTIKSEEVKQSILAILEHKQLPNVGVLTTRGVGTTIIGFMLMFILMQSSVLMGMFSDDKEHKQIKRVIASPIKMRGYLFAHCLFNFCFLFFPNIIILYIVKFLLNVDIGFTFLQYSMLLSLICIFATSFSLLMNALVKKGDTANMAGSSIIVLTSVLAGSFYSFDKGNDILEKIIQFLPQKAYLNVVSEIEQHLTNSDTIFAALYVIILIIIFFSVAIIKTRRDYIQA